MNVTQSVVSTDLESVSLFSHFFKIHREPAEGSVLTAV